METRNMNDTATYRKSVTPGVAPATASQRKLQELKFCPLGRLTLLIDEIDRQIQLIEQSPKPSRMVISTLLATKFNTLKSLLPYAYCQVPAESADDNITRVPVVITLDATEIMKEEAELLDKINETLEEAREQFPDYNDGSVPMSEKEKYRLAMGIKT